jgi:hypothetical protein
LTAVLVAGFAVAPAQAMPKASTPYPAFLFPLAANAKTTGRDTAAAMTFATPQSDTGKFLDTVLTISHYVLAHLNRFGPKGYKEQLRTCNTFQRSGYTNVAFELVGGDGLLSLFQLLKTNLDVAFGMFHIEFTIRISETLTITLPENWDFPDDPWKREWWTAN